MSAPQSKILVQDRLLKVPDTTKFGLPVIGEAWPILIGNVIELLCITQPTNFLCRVTRNKVFLKRGLIELAGVYSLLLTKACLLRDNKLSLAPVD